MSKSSKKEIKELESEKLSEDLDKSESDNYYSDSESEITDYSCDYEEIVEVDDNETYYKKVNSKSEKKTRLLKSLQDIKLSKREVKQLLKNAA